MAGCYPGRGAAARTGRRWQKGLGLEVAPTLKEPLAITLRRNNVTCASRRRRARRSRRVTTVSMRPLTASPAVTHAGGALPGAARGDVPVGVGAVAAGKGAVGDEAARRRLSA